MSSILTTNTVKPKGGDNKPVPLRHVRVDDLKVKTQFDFTAGQFKEVRPHASAFGRGPLQTSQLREMAENKARMAASAAKKLAMAKAMAEGLVKDIRGTKKARKAKAKAK